MLVVELVTKGCLQLVPIPLMHHKVSDLAVSNSH